LEQVHESAISLLHDGAYYWAVRHEDMNLIDPPVYTYLQNLFENRRAVDSVSTFALDRVLIKVYAMGGGGFEAGVTDRHELVRQLKSVFPHHLSVGKAEVFEGDNILAQLRLRADVIDLQVEVLNPVSRELIPSFLWEYSRTTTARHGMFLADE
jgi:hypothetical protein